MCISCLLECYNNYCAVIVPSINLSKFTDGKEGVLCPEQRRYSRSDQGSIFKLNKQYDSDKVPEGGKYLCSKFPTAHLWKFLQLVSANSETHGHSRLPRKATQTVGAGRSGGGGRWGGEKTSLGKTLTQVTGTGQSARIGIPAPGFHTDHWSGMRNPICTLSLNSLSVKWGWGHPPLYLPLI